MRPAALSDMVASRREPQWGLLVPSLRLFSQERQMQDTISQGLL
jgi:hypothetical protein